MTTRRLSVALHLLVHLSHRPDFRTTSADLARCVRTNPVVIRRALAGLRKAGFVRSVPGHGGGWSLARDPKEISLGEVCRVLGERVVFSVGMDSPSGCRVQAAVVDVLDGILREVEAELLERLNGVSIASLGSQAERRGRDAALSGHLDRESVVALASRVRGALPPTRER